VQLDALDSAPEKVLIWHKFHSLDIYVEFSFPMRPQSGSKGYDLYQIQVLPFKALLLDFIM
jgi:hypothetical protein